MDNEEEMDIKEELEIKQDSRKEYLGKFQYKVQRNILYTATRCIDVQIGNVISKYSRYPPFLQAPKEIINQPDINFII